MTVRHFDGVDDFIIVSPGGLAAFDGGPITIAAIWRPSASTQAGNIIRARNAAHSTTWSINPFSDGNVYYGTVVGSAVLNTYTANEWYLTAATKGNGSAQCRQHRYVFSTTTWTHTDVGSPFGDSTNVPVADITFGRQTDSIEFLNGDLALIGVWGSILADSTLEGLTTRLDAWKAATPTALWAFNQSAITEAVVDLTGGGADQTSITGTNVVTGQDPPGFSFLPAAGGAVYTMRGTPPTMVTLPARTKPGRTTKRVLLPPQDES